MASQVNYQDIDLYVILIKQSGRRTLLRNGYGTLFKVA